MRVLIFRNLENQNPHKYNFSIIYFIFYYFSCIFGTHEIKLFKKLSNYYLKSLISKKYKIQKVKILFKLPIKEKYNKLLKNYTYGDFDFLNF